MKSPSRRALKFFAGVLVAGTLLAACAGAGRIVRDPLLSDYLLPDQKLVCSVERGMGGTGVSDGERGMGGTGLMAASTERGMGGTGIGAGVIGTVTGFGSICVSGVRIAYDETTAVTVQNAPVALETLARGMTVAATVAAQGGELTATRIDILHALVGPVTSLMPFTVMNAPIATGDAAGDPAVSFAVGDMVVIDGLQRADGVIDATRIVRAAPGADASVRGAADMPAPGILRVGAVPVAVTPGSSSAFAGRWIAVTGVWNGDRLMPASLSAVLELALARDMPVSLEGHLLPRPGGGFAIRGVPVLENVARRLPLDVIARLAAGQRVQVIGVGDVDGAVRPQTIVVPAFESPLRAEISPADPATEAAADAAARRRAAAAGAETREAPQLERGVYGAPQARPEAVRPDAARSVTPVVPDAIRTRPPPTRPVVPARPEAPPQRPRGG